jgi:hypothetical protein
MTPPFEGLAMSAKDRDQTISLRDSGRAIWETICESFGNDRPTPLTEIAGFALMREGSMCGWIKDRYGGPIAALPMDLGGRHHES